MEIMKTPLLPRALYSLAFVAFTSAPTIFAGEITLQKVPPLTVEQSPSYPENLARYHLGAQVEAGPQSHPISNLQLSSNSEDRNGAEAALLCDDPTVGYALPSGKSTLLVSLPKIENVGRISFLNKNTKGEVTVATASAKLPADSPQWHTVLQQELSTQALQANVGPSEAKYVRLTFNVSEPGRIAGFGVYSTPRVSDFTAPRTRKLPVQDKSDSFALISYNLTDIHAKGRALYVSSGSDVRQANNMIDDQTTTAYSFGSEDVAPTAVIDLGKPSTLRRMSAVYAPRAGKMDFYVLQTLPAVSSSTSNGSNNVKLTDEAIANMKTVGSVTDDGSQGRASIDFPATAGRYVMVRWTPSAQADSSFALAEVAAFGAGSRNTLLAANTEAPGGGEVSTERYDGKTEMDGKTMIDTKDMPAEGPAERSAPAEGPPPSLPQPPPFTFVPVLGPTSP